MRTQHLIVFIPLFVCPSMLWSQANNGFGKQVKRFLLPDESVPYAGSYPGYSGPAAKTSATASRLVSAVNLRYADSVYLPTDSTIYTYAGDATGHFDDMNVRWEWDFDVAIGYPASSAGYGTVNTWLHRHYNASSAPDTSWDDRWGTSSGPVSSRTFFQYDVSGRLVSSTQQSWDSLTFTWHNYYRQTATYTSAGKPATIFYELWDTSMSWQNYFHRFYTWSATGLLLKDSLQKWNGTSLAWEHSVRNYYTYDGSDNCIKWERENWLGSAAGWDIRATTYSRNFDAFHNPGTVVNMGYNYPSLLWDSVSRDHFVYNSDGYVESYYEEKWWQPTGNWLILNSFLGARYHYEAFTPGYISSTPVTPTGISVFPVPANDNISISAQWDTPQTFGASITDMAGRTYTSWRGKTAGEYREKLPVNHLPPGNYILAIHTKQGSVTKQFSVVR